MSFEIAKAVELLEAAKSNNRLAHAYLITGPRGSGKEALAIRMIEMVNGQSGVLPAANLEDLRNSTNTVIGPQSVSRRITIDAIRAAEHTLQMAAPAGVTKFAVIKDADRMMEAAENAFLKTLEEPPAGSRLLLLSANPEMLLETILSRCISIPLKGKGGPAEVSESARVLLEKLSSHAKSGENSLSSALGLVATFSSILKAKKADIAKRNEDALKEEAAHYRNKTEGDYIKKREEYYKAMTAAEYIDQRNRLVEYLVMWFGDALRQQNGSKNLDLPDYADVTAKMATERSNRDLCKRVEAVEELRSNLHTNVFEALALEAGFIRAFG